jgi:hypothetical protein
MPDFGQFQTFFDKEGKPYSVTAEKFYVEKLEAVYQCSKGDSRTMIEEAIADGVELMWHQNSKTYFRIYPEYVDVLTNIRLLIPGEYFKLPFTAFAVSLPAGAISFEDTYVSAVLCGLTQNAMRHMLDMHVAVRQQEGVTEPPPPRRPLIQPLGPQLTAAGFVPERTHGVFMMLQLADGRTPATSVSYSELHTLERAVELRDAALVELHTGGLLHRNNAAVLKLIRLIVATTFLAAGNDRIIEPDVLGKDFNKFLAAKQAGDTDVVERLHEKATKRRKCRGFVIGRNQQLPRTAFGDARDSAAEKRALQWSHQRCGHFHGYHTKNGYVIKWITQLTVRPDLPVKAGQRGYDI